MHRIILLAFTLIPLVASAQQAVVRYNHTYAILYRAANPIHEYIAEQGGKEYSQGPRYATVSRNLAFSPASSLMYPAVKQVIVPGERRGAEHVDTTYVSFDDRAYTESREFFGNVYLVKDRQPMVSWRMSGEERMYFGHRVMKATAVVKSALVEAWFAPEIPVPAGPGLYGGLPGLILRVTNTAIGEVYAADFVDLDEQPRITAPVGGRVVSHETYSRVKTEELANDQRFWDMIRRDIEEGRMTVNRREFDLDEPLGKKKQ